MGWCPQVLVLVLVLVCPASPTICDFSQCNCTTVAGRWINAVCVFNNTQRQLDITPESLPRNLAELEISGPREMVLLNGSFSRNLSALSLVRLTDLGALTVERKAFARLTNPHLFLQVVAAQRVIMESNAFHELRSATVSVHLERVDHLIIQGKAFDRLVDVEILSVPQLELQANAFYFEPTKGEEVQGPGTKIKLERVRVKELPYNVFPSLNQLMIAHSEVGVVRPGSLRALKLIVVTVFNTTIGQMDTDALTNRCEIGRLELDGVRVGRLLSECVQAGISKLIVRGSSLSDVSESALHSAIASVTLSENVFNQVRSRGFSFAQTSTLYVENNRFNILEDSAFVLPEGETSVQSLNITFRGNSLGREIGKGALDFTRTKHTVINVDNNGFDFQCQCESTSKNLLKEKINGTDRVIDLFYETSLCQINLDLSRCFSIPSGLFLMDNFTALACDANGQYVCPEVVQSDAAIPSFPGMTSDIIYENSTDRERKVLGSIFIVVISGVIIMLCLSGFMWLRRNGYCTKARLLLLPSADSMLNIISRMFVGTTNSANSVAVNRVSTHEYAELQQVQKQMEESPEEVISLEDKATQTLPEELTQELLQTLREKLDDPENYSEARDMIEHLYDLIKVEESCNQNSEFTSLQMDELEEMREGENVYDVIQPPKPRLKNRVSKEKKTLVSIGTRAPSPDKLLPLSLSRLKPAVLCDYTEPRDRRPHLYQELPAAQPLASVLCDYAEPPDSKPHVYLELSSAMANRPLPSKPVDPGEGPSSR